MTRLRARLCRTLVWTHVARAALAAPGLAVTERAGRTIEAPGVKGKGVGFLPLVSLQRA